MTSEESPSAADNDNVPVNSISKEELTELVRAIHFAKPEASQRQVHREITQEIPQRFPKFAFLAQEDALTFNDVRKVWKKATQQQQPSSSAPSSTNEKNADLLAKLKELNVTPQMFTVGDATKKTEQISSSVAALYIQELLNAQQSEQDAQQAELQDYVHVFLNVPANTSGARPHQAIINFQSKPQQKSGKKNKGSGKKKAADNTATTAHPDAPFEDALIVKIQMAAPLDEMDTHKHPMLLYDQSRKLQTFVHYQAASGESADDGYLKIAKWIDAQGKAGALGNSGGVKAYFWARLTSTTKKGMDDILSVYMKELAPPQEW